MPLDALCHEIDAAAIRLIDGFEGIVLGPVPRFNFRERMFAGPAQIQVACHGQQRVPYGLCIQAAAVKPPIRLVARIFRDVGFVVSAGSLVSL